MRPRGLGPVVGGLLSAVLASCGTGADVASPTEPAAATAAIEDDSRWVGTTGSGAAITAEAPAEDDHPLVEQAEEYREAAHAPEVVYVVVVFDNTDGTETIDVFGGGRLVTDEGEEIAMPHLASAGGVYEDVIEDHLPMTLEDEAYEWYAEFYKHQAVAAGSVEEVVLGTTAEVSSIAELYVSLDEQGGETRLEPAS
jgi:hypothetical protein